MNSKKETAIAIGLLVTGLVAPGSISAQEVETKSVTYIVGTSDLNVGYPFATLPEALGYFDDEGLDVTIVPGTSSSGTLQLLLSGRGHFGVAQPDPFIIQKIDNQIPLISVYPISRRGTYQIAVLPDSSIQSVEDLKGKRVGVSNFGAAGVTYLSAQLTEVGLDPADAELVPIGYGSPSYEALNDGTVDASVSFTTSFVRQELAGYEFRFLPGDEHEKENYSYNLYANAEYVEANPDVVEKIGRATAKATVFMKNNPEAAVRIFWDQFPDRAPKDPSDPKSLQHDLAILKGMIHDMQADELPDDFQWGKQDAETWDRMQQSLANVGLISETIDPGTFYTNEFVDEYNAFDHEAIARSAREWEGASK